jgi:GTPase SAR1 family protein
MAVPDFIIKVVMRGDAGVGKTNLVLRWIDDIFLDKPTSTIGFDFRVKTVTVDDNTLA